MLSDRQARYVTVESGIFNSKSRCGTTSVHLLPCVASADAHTFADGFAFEVLSVAASAFLQLRHRACRN